MSGQEFTIEQTLEIPRSSSLIETLRLTTCLHRQCKDIFGVGRHIGHVWQWTFVTLLLYVLRAETDWASKEMLMAVALSTAQGAGQIVVCQANIKRRNAWHSQEHKPILLWVKLHANLADIWAVMLQWYQREEGVRIVENQPWPGTRVAHSLTPSEARRMLVLYYAYSFCPSYHAGYLESVLELPIGDVDRWLAQFLRLHVLVLEAQHRF